MLGMIIPLNRAILCQDPEDHKLGCDMCTSTTLVITEDYPKGTVIIFWNAGIGNPYEPVFFMGVAPKVDTAAAMQRFQETVRWGWPAAMRRSTLHVFIHLGIFGQIIATNQPPKWVV